MTKIGAPGEKKGEGEVTGGEKVRKRKVRKKEMMKRTCEKVN